MKRNTDPRFNIIPDIINTTSENSEEAKKGIEIYNKRHIERLKRQAKNFKEIEVSCQEAISKDSESFESSQVFNKYKLIDIAHDISFLIKGFCEEDENNSTMFQLVLNIDKKINEFNALVINGADLEKIDANNKEQIEIASLLADEIIEKCE